MDDMNMNVDMIWMIGDDRDGQGMWDANQKSSSVSTIL